MLTILKKAASTWVAKIFLGVLILSFAVWGITGASFNFVSGTIASVGSAKVSTIDFQRRFQAEIFQLTQQIGRRLTAEQAQQFGLDQQVLGRLINQAALDDRTNKFQISISQNMLEERVLANPLFQDAEGEFSPGAYQQLLFSSQLTESDFMKSQRAAYARAQIIDALTADLPVPQVLQEAINTHSFEERTLEFLVLNSDKIPAIKPADNKQLAKYYEANKNRYRAPEYRSLKYLAVQTSDFNAEAGISDADARDHYEENKSRFEIPEQRTIRRITFHQAEDAKAAEEKIKGGMTFDMLASELGLKNEDLMLGTQPKQAILDRKLGDAAFELEAGQPSAAVETDFGHAVIIVDDVKGGGVQAFEDAEAEIKKFLATDLNNDALSQKLDLVEEGRIAGESFEEIAQKHSIKLVTVSDVAQSGELASGGQIDSDTPSLDELLREAFETDIAVENDVLEIGRDGYLWFEVTDVKEARDRSLDEVREMVAADWLVNETDKALASEAEKLTEKIKNGTPLTDLAKNINTEVKTANGVKRGDAAEGLSGPAVALAFSGPEGHTLSAPGDEANQVFVIRVSSIKQPENETSAEGAEQLKQSIQNDVIETYMAGIRDREGTTINRQALESVINPDHNGYGGRQHF